MENELRERVKELEMQLQVQRSLYNPEVPLQPGDVGRAVALLWEVGVPVLPMAVPKWLCDRRAARGILTYELGPMIPTREDRVKCVPCNSLHAALETMAGALKQAGVGRIRAFTDVCWKLRKKDHTI